MSASWTLNKYLRNLHGKIPKAEHFSLQGIKSPSRTVLIYFLNNRPSTKEALLKLEDFPEAKVEKFGMSFLDVVVPFCKDHDLSTDQFPDLDMTKVKNI